MNPDFKFELDRSAEQFNRDTNDVSQIDNEIGYSLEETDNIKCQD